MKPILVAIALALTLAGGQAAAKGCIKGAVVGGVAGHFAHHHALLGAAAGQVGTAYLRSTEAGTSDAQRTATDSDTPTVLTRAFSGRMARGIVNRWHREHGDAAPRAYPEVHHLTSPLRGHGRSVGDSDLINLWAGQAHALAEDRSAGELVRRWSDEARTALERAGRRLTTPDG